MRPATARFALNVCWLTRSPVALGGRFGAHGVFSVDNFTMTGDAEGPDVITYTNWAPGFPSGAAASDQGTCGTYRTSGEWC